MGDGTSKIVRHKMEDGLNLLLGISGIERQRLILDMVSKKSIVSLERQNPLTQSPRSRISRARYIAAAAT